MNSFKPLCTLIVTVLIIPDSLLAADVAATGIKPTGKDGRALNFDFEDGSLRDWTATGTAFAQQPIKGDTVAVRRGDMKSGHQGQFWIGGYEKVGDNPQGTLTSASFRVMQPWCSFIFAGGNGPNTRVELVRADTQKVFFKSSGVESETLRPVVVNLEDHRNKEIFIRLLDEEGGPWGHLNFDNFVFHDAKPSFSNALDPAKTVDVPPPADVVKFAGLSPEDAAKEATLPPGFKMHLFAGEPDVVQPIAFTTDERGRLWVAEGMTYPRRRGQLPADTRPVGTDRQQPTAEQLKDIYGGSDRILVFEDTNGDHKFDKRTVFAEGLNLVSGIEYGFGGLWVGAAPYLLFIPVADGDSPKPAGEPKILLDGWDYKADTHETLNTFTWGPDGWLYGCHGVFCPSFVAKPGTPAQDRQRMDAGVWRYHPTKHEFEVFAEGTSNPWGVDFDEHGQCIIEACVIPHFWHMIQGGRFERQGGQHFNINLTETSAHENYHADSRQRHINPFIYEDIKTHGDHVHYAGDRGPHAANGRSDAAGGGHAHAGLMMYLGDSWPAEYRNKAFMNNIHGQRLNTDILERKGSGYVGKHGPDFVNFNDTWSQVLNMRYDQDGSVYLIDWYDKNQCHHNREDGHDRANGRIFKIVYNNQPVTKVDLGKKSDEDLLALAVSKNEWMSRTARRLMRERAAALLAAFERDPQQSQKVQALHGLFAEKLMAKTQGSHDSATKLRAIWTLHVLDAVGSLANVGRFLRNDDEIVRSWVIQCVSEELPGRFNGVPGPDGKVENDSAYWKRLRKAFSEMARTDNSPVVRLSLASALQRMRPEHRWEIVIALISHADDATDHNLPLMYWFALEPCIEADPDRAIALLKECKIPKIREFISRRLTTMSLAQK
ncbi:MAG: dehydrogenase [Pedosphaera sp.]|nr:dehydrogenase [Pedosphaera sp.]